MATTRIVMPDKAKKGEVIEIKTIIQHVMETGYRRDYQGVTIARDIIKRYSVEYAGAEIFSADLTQGVAANPYFAFSTVAVQTGDIVFTWTDDKGEKTVVTKKLTVT
jgi:sulfur-oxidizing protein SoxZ